jgi:hypothetical protein
LLGELEWKELGKALLAALIAAIAGSLIARAAPYAGDRLSIIFSLGLISVTWAAAAAATLWITNSELPKLLRRRS